MKNQLFKKILIIQLIILLFTPQLYAEISVVVHPDNPVSSITNKDVRKIYLGKSKKFPGGGALSVIDQKSGAVRDGFYKKVVKKNVTKLKAYWSKRIFTGKGNPPPTVDNDGAVINWIQGQTSGLGYIDSGSVNAKVKVLLTIP